MTTRRDFLRDTAMAGSSLALAASHPTSAAPEPPPWFDRPMRWGLLTLVEDDSGKYGLNFWLDYFQRTHSDAACLSAGAPSAPWGGFLMASTSISMSRH